MVLTGTEIKSVRAGKIDLRTVREGPGFRNWLYNVHISPFEQGTYYNHEPLRPRKLSIELLRDKAALAPGRGKRA